jgi:hypothetical protein
VWSEASTAATVGPANVSIRAKENARSIVCPFLEPIP